MSTVVPLVVTSYAGCPWRVIFSNLLRVGTLTEWASERESIYLKHIHHLLHWGKPFLSAFIQCFDVCHICPAQLRFPASRNEGSHIKCMSMKVGTNWNKVQRDSPFNAWLDSGRCMRTCVCGWVCMHPCTLTRLRPNEVRYIHIYMRVCMRTDLYCAHYYYSSLSLMKCVCVCVFSLSLSQPNEMCVSVRVRAHACVCSHYPSLSLMKYVCVCMCVCVLNWTAAVLCCVQAVPLNDKVYWWLQWDHYLPGSLFIL